MPGPADIGLTHKDIHEARIIRDAEVADPGIVRRALDEKLAAGEEPTKIEVARGADGGVTYGAEAAHIVHDEEVEERD